MESMQRDLLCVLLGRIFSLGLISKEAYSSAVDGVHAAKKLPALLQRPACVTEEASGHECAQDPQ